MAYLDSLSQRALADAASTDRILAIGVSEADEYLALADLAAAGEACIIRATSAGVLTRHYPTDRDDPAAWWSRLDSTLDLVNAGSGGDVVILPPVVFQPGSSDTSTLQVAVPNVTIMGNGAMIARGASTPAAGVFVTLDATTTARDLTIDDDGSAYKWIDRQTVLVVGENDPAVDTLAMERAIQSLESIGGGTIRFRGTVTLHYEELSGTIASSSTTLNMGDRDSPISLIGYGQNESVLELWKTNVYWQAGASDNNWDSTYADASGEPSTPGSQHMHNFAVDDHGLAAGDWVYIWSEEYADKCEVWHGTYEQLPGELQKVAEVADADNFKIEEPFYDQLTTCYIRKMDPYKGFAVKDFSIIQRAPRDNLTFIECRDFVVENIRYEYDEQSPLISSTCFGITIKDSCLFRCTGLSFAHGTETGDTAWATGQSYTTYPHTSWVVYNSILYRCLVDHTSATGVNEPSGAETDNTWWAYSAGSDGVQSGSCILLAGAPCHGVIRDVHSTTVHHHFDTGSHYVGSITDAAAPSGSFYARIGTAREILIDNWQAKQLSRENSQVIFHTHESGRRLIFSNCTATFIVVATQAYGFNTASRDTWFENCHVVGDGSGGYGFYVLGPRARISNCSVINTYYGVFSRHEDTEILNSRFVNQSIAIALGGLDYNGTTYYADRALIQGNSFVNDTEVSRTDDALSFIYVHDNVVGMQILNNYMPRGINKSAVHFDTYATGYDGSATVKACSGNSMPGWGDHGVLGSEAFLEGASDATVCQDANDDFEADNFYSRKASTNSYDVEDHGNYSLTNTGSVNYSLADWKLVATCNLRSLGATGMIFSQEGGNSWLGVSVSGDRWYTKLDGNINYFDNLPVAEVGAMYHAELFYDQSEGEATLTVNGTSETISITHASSTGNFRVGSDNAGSYEWNGDCGIRLEQPVGTETASYP